MEGRRFFHSLRLTNFLSFGPEGVEIDLLPMNVLIGPNGSGKSNLIEAISLLRAAPRDLAQAIRDSGGISELSHKGSAGWDKPGVEITVHVVDETRKRVLRHTLRVEAHGVFPVVAEESVADSSGKSFYQRDAA